MTTFKLTPLGLKLFENSVGKRENAAYLSKMNSVTMIHIMICALKILSIWAGLKLPCDING